jgi:hypothetical protein
MGTFLTFVIIIVVLIAAGWVASKSYVRIPENTVGLKKRIDRTRWTAVALRPGVHWRVPMLEQVETEPAVRVRNNMIGLVTAKEGVGRPTGQLLGRPVECDSFQDSAAFLRNGGEQGLQVTVLRSGQVYYLNPHLFEVEFVPRTHVPDGTVGLVIARAGKTPPPDRLFGRHVECDDFQDGAAFITGGGEQGRQLALLGSGDYDINPELFRVVTTANVADLGTGLTARQLRLIKFDAGDTGVVITAEGAPPERDAKGTQLPAPVISGHQNFRLPWVFLDGGGRKGIQAETLPGGVPYALNPWFVSVVLVPVRQVILEWTKDRQTDLSRYDAELDPIMIQIDGHRLFFEMTQIVRIPERAAPRLVSEFGGHGGLDAGGLIDDKAPVQRFVEKTLGSKVEAYFTAKGTEMRGKDFQEGFPYLQPELALAIGGALKPWGVDAITTTLSQYETDDEDFQAPMRAAYAAEASKRALTAQIETAGLRDELDQVEFKKELRRAELQFRALVDILGRSDALMIRTIQEYTNMKVPSYIGGGDMDRIVGALPVPALTELLGRLGALAEGRPGTKAAGSIVTGAELLDQVEDDDS